MNPFDENMPPTSSNSTGKPAAKKIEDTNVEKANSMETPSDETDKTTKKRPIAVAVAAETVDDDETAEPSKRSRNSEEVLDLANILGYKSGDRFEVCWELVPEGADETAEPEQRWWGATLLEHDGRTEDSVAVRVLRYDAYPQGGFAERSLEDVIFLGRDNLIDPSNHQEMEYRREGQDDSESTYVNRDDIEQVVNDTLSNAFKKNSASWNNLSRSQQASIAEIVAEKKERLVELLLNQPNRVITPSQMQDILARTMQE